MRADCVSCRANLAGKDDVLPIGDSHVQERPPVLGAEEAHETTVDRQRFAAGNVGGGEHAGLFQIVQRWRRGRRASNRDAVGPVRHGRWADELNPVSVRQAGGARRHVVTDALPR